MSTRFTAILLVALLFLPISAAAQLADGNSTDRECTTSMNLFTARALCGSECSRQ